MNKYVPTSPKDDKTQNLRNSPLCQYSLLQVLVLLLAISWHVCAFPMHVCFTDAGTSDICNYVKNWRDPT